MKIHAHLLIEAIQHSVHIRPTVYLSEVGAIYKDPDYGGKIVNFIKNSHKFYCGEMEAIPPLDLEKMEPLAFNLPFDNCYFEMTLKDECTVVFLTKKIENATEVQIYAYRKGESLTQWLHFPYICTLESDSKTLSVAIDKTFLMLSISKEKVVMDKFKDIFKKLENPQFEELFESRGFSKENITKELEKFVEELAAFPNKLTEGRSECAEEFLKPVLMEFYAFLSILNCCNITRVFNEPDRALNKAKIKRKQCPEYPFHTIKIKGSNAVNMFSSTRMMTGERAEARLHWRRGHIKHRATGNFWWNPHVVGSGGEKVLTGTVKNTEYVYEKDNA